MAHSRIFTHRNLPHMFCFLVYTRTHLVGIVLVVACASVSVLSLFLSRREMDLRKWK